MEKYLVSYGYDIFWDYEWETKYSVEEWKNALKQFWKYARTWNFKCNTLKEVNKILRENKMYYTQYVVLRLYDDEIVKTNLM